MDSVSFATCFHLEVEWRVHWIFPQLIVGLPERWCFWIVLKVIIVESEHFGWFLRVQFDSVGIGGGLDFLRSVGSFGWGLLLALAILVFELQVETCWFSSLTIVWKGLHYNFGRVDFKCCFGKWAARSDSVLVWHLSWLLGEKRTKVRFDLV